MPSDFSNKGMFGISLASIVTAVVLVSMNFNALKSPDFDMIPMNSVLHGVKARKFPFNHIKIDDAVKDIDAFIDWTYTRDEAWTADKLPSKIELLTGEVFTSTNTSLPHMRKYFNVKDVAEFSLTAENEKQNNQNFIMYAMGCVEWAEDSSSTNDPKDWKLSIAIDADKTEACKCVKEHFSDFDMDDDEDEQWWYKKIAKTCAMRNSNKYVVEYAGAVNTERIMQRGFAFLFAALIMMLVQNQNPSNNDSSVFESKLADKNSWYRHFVAISLLAGFGFIVMVSSIEGADLRVDKSFKVSDDSKLLTERDYIGKETPDDYDVTSYESSYLSTVNLLRIVWYGGLIAYSVLGGALVFSTYYQPNLNGFSFDALIRFLIDVPLIVGLTMAGVSVLLQNGYTNYEYIDINILLILSICFLQHISNLVKMFYDAVCRNTDSSVFKQLYYKGGTLEEPETTKNMDKNSNTRVADFTPEYSDEKCQKVTSVLQFFGWFRVWIFLLVTLGTVLFLTMTNELVKTTSLGNFFSSQVLVFAFVLYVTNVGYDVVRELLPVEFERYHTDSTRFWVVSLYIGTGWCVCLPA